MKEYFKNMKDKKFLISIGLMLILQCITYAVLKNFQSNYHTFNYNIDNKLPFIPQMVYIYNIFYPAIFFAFYTVFNKDKDTYYKGIIAGTIGFIIADIIFLIYPTVMIRPDLATVSMDPLTRLVMEITYNVDTPAINCFPSMHCVFSFQAMYTIIMSKNLNKKTKYVYSILLFLIIISTLFVKQHYLIDIISALGIVVITNIISNLIYKKK